MDTELNELWKQYDHQSLTKTRTKEQKKWMWIVLFGCFLLQMFPYCVAMNLTNVFVGSDWNVWTQGNTTIIGLTFSIGSVISALVGPLIARIFNKKISMRFIYSLGIFVAMIGFFGASFIVFIPESQRNLPIVSAILWITNAIKQIGVMVFSGLGVNNLISQWWPAEKRGFALGLAFTGGSLGNIWMQQLIGHLSQVFGNTLASDANNNYVHNGNQWIT